MNQANQKQLFQETNMNLIAIRTAEVDYFTTFFANFGTQAALIVTCITGSVSQVPGITSESADFFTIMYWITTAVTIAGAMHVLLCTVFINIYGQGLALRGPVGSMVQAVEGMVVEQKQVLIAFIITCAFFGFNMICMFWIMMDQRSAITSSVVVLVGMYFWYTYCLRIYNRFSWDMSKDNADWKDRHRNSDEYEDPEPFAPPIYNPDHLNNNINNSSSSKKSVSNNNDNNNSSSSSKSSSSSSSSSSSKSSIYNNNDNNNNNNINNYNSNSSVISKKTASTPFLSDSGHSSSSSSTDSSVSATNGTLDMAAQEEFFGAPSNGAEHGYLTFKGDRILTLDPWERKYFLLRGGRLYYYESKSSYKEAATKPINSRPIDLDGYSLDAQQSEAPYPITLTPTDPADIRKTWQFRCDTIAEQLRWVTLFETALNKLSARNQT